MYKVPNGKLLKIFLDYDEKNFVIKKINIMGDFFAYPEESIELIENKLKNTKIEKKILYKKIYSIIKENKIEFIGLNEQAIIDGIMMCKK
jgi:hypothetical protein